MTLDSRKHPWIQALREGYSNHSCEDKTFLCISPVSRPLAHRSVVALKQWWGGDLNSGTRKTESSCVRNEQQIQAKSSRVPCGCTPVPEPGFWDVRGCPTLIHLWKTTSAVLPVVLTRKPDQEPFAPSPNCQQLYNPIWSSNAKSSSSFSSLLGTACPNSPGCPAVLQLTSIRGRGWKICYQPYQMQGLKAAVSPG